MLRKEYRTTFLAALVVAALAGCGEASQEPRVASANGASQSARSIGQGDWTKYRDCLKDKGVDVDATGTPTADAALEAARDACHEYLPDGGELTKTSPQDVENARAYAKCMRENGVPTFPDPLPNGARTDYSPPDVPIVTLGKAAEICVRSVPLPPSQRG